jgi:hypothetical protein
MRKVVLLMIFAVVVSRGATADVVRHGSIPESYRGTWVADATTGSEKPVIALSAKTYVSREASCSVDWVSQTAGARGSIYAAHLQCVHPAGEEREKTASNLIIWPDSNDKITVGPDFRSLKAFHRCSATHEAQGQLRCDSALSDGAD